MGRRARFRARTSSSARRIRILTMAMPSPATAARARPRIAWSCMWTRRLRGEMPPVVLRESTLERAARARFALDKTFQTNACSVW
jgi:hypothetical protein